MRTLLLSLAMLGGCLHRPPEFQRLLTIETVTPGAPKPKVTVIFSIGDPDKNSGKPDMAFSPPEHLLNSGGCRYFSLYSRRTPSAFRIADVSHPYKVQITEAGHWPEAEPIEFEGHVEILPWKGDPIYPDRPVHFGVGRKNEITLACNDDEWPEDPGK